MFMYLGPDAGIIGICRTSPTDNKKKLLIEEIKYPSKERDPNTVIVDTNLLSASA